jgi:hypothetical protein
MHSAVVLQIGYGRCRKASYVAHRTEMQRELAIIAPEIASDRSDSIVQ